MEENKEEIYSKWLSNELTEAELQRLRDSGDWEILEQIRKETDNWELPPVRSNYQELKTRLQKQQKKSKVRTVYRNLAIAASFLILITGGYYLYSVFYTKVLFETMAGNTKEITLPDDTQVKLYGQSTLSYYEYNWEKNRKVEITGKVYFEVTKKGSFEVDFKGGKVQVTGTSFEILAGENFQQVKCIEGSVTVTLKDKEFDLQPGHGVNSLMEIFEFDAAEERNGSNEYTEYENARLPEVLESLTLQFGFDFENVDQYYDRLFTGRFTNENGEKALEMIFAPLGIEYVKIGSRVTLK